MNNNIPALTKPRYWIRMHFQSETSIDGKVHPVIMFDETEVYKLVDEAQAIFKARRFTIFKEKAGKLSQQKTWLSQAWLCLNDKEKLQAAQDLELLT